MKLYISGPMTGFKDLNRIAFEKRKYDLEAQGHEVIMPHDVQGPRPDMTYDDWMKADVAMMMTCDAVHMMKGWLDSNGAVKEWQIARLLNMPILYEEK